MGGISVAKNFRQEGTMYEEFRGVNAQRYQVNLRQGFVFSAIFPILTTIAGLGTTGRVGCNWFSRQEFRPDWALRKRQR